MTSMVFDWWNDLHGIIEVARLSVLFIIIHNSSFVDITYKALTAEFLRSILMLNIPEFLLATQSNSKITKHKNGTIGKADEDKIINQ